MSKKKVLSLALVVIMIAILSFSTLAWFNDTDSVKNEFHIATSDDASDADDIFSVDLWEKTPDSVKETLLVLDATTGQNGLIQARQFKETAGLTGIILTKLDGTAKGGIVIAIAQELQVPVKFVGLGEGIDDLQPFDAQEFLEAMI